MCGLGDNEDEDMSDVAPGSAEDSSQEDGSDQEEEDQGSSEADDDRGGWSGAHYVSCLMQGYSLFGWQLMAEKKVDAIFDP